MWICVLFDFFGSPVQSWRGFLSSYREPDIPAIWDMKFGSTWFTPDALWDALIEKGKDFGMKPAGMLALDVARLEAGFILLEVDYTSAEKAVIPSQRYSPFEIGLGWTVDLHKSDFVGHRALRQETHPVLSRQIVGLEISLTDYEYLFQQVGLPPQYPLAAWRGGVPVYKDDRQIGHATTGAWSPILKKIHCSRNREQTMRRSRNGARHRSYRRASTKDCHCQGSKNAFFRSTAETSLGARFVVIAHLRAAFSATDEPQRRVWPKILCSRGC
jgi:hypothetical protein